MKWQQIKSDKHVGATFFKVEGTKKKLCMQSLRWT